MGGLTFGEGAVAMDTGPSSAQARGAQAAIFLRPSVWKASLFSASPWRLRTAGTACASRWSWSSCSAWPTPITSTFWPRGASSRTRPLPITSSTCCTGRSPTTPSSSSTRSACTCWSCCSTNTSARSWSTHSAPSSLTSSRSCTGSTTPASGCASSRPWPSNPCPSSNTSSSSRTLSSSTSRPHSPSPSRTAAPSSEKEKMADGLDSAVCHNFWNSRVSYMTIFKLMSLQKL